MALDPYAPCPCGSGKKSKWCCLPIYADIERAFQQHADGQHEAAVHTLDQAIAAHPDNPELLGRKAIVVRDLGQVDEADQLLDRAFQLNPKYPFGLYLKGRFREEEGEVAGALALYRKAAEVYDPLAHETLAVIYGSIAECEMKLNRPVAARAAVQIALQHDPRPDGYRKVLDTAFGPRGGLPESARKEYTYLSPPASTPAAKTKSWRQALNQQTTGQLTDARTAFEQLTTEDPENAAAWYNLGLTRAWLGDNAGALQALDEYVRREPDEGRAGAAWALGEVLRCGEGLQETEADHAEHARVYQIRVGEKVGGLIQDLNREQRLAAAQVREEQRLFTAIIVEPPTLLVAGAPSTEAPRFGAHMMVVSNILRLWSVNSDGLAKVGREVEERMGDAISLAGEQTTPAQFPDILSQAMIFPIVQEGSKEEDYRQKVGAGVGEFLEETWIHRHLRSLSGVPPIDAAGHAVLRKKLRGTVQFLQDCAAIQQLPYDFDRLRRKLGLLQPAPAVAATGKPDLSVLGAAELAALNSDTLSDEELEQAYQAARKLDAQEIGTTFLKKLVARPPQANKADRFPWYQQLIQQTLGEKNLDAALDYVNEGEKTDCEYNEGRRRNDYELWRGRVHAKRGELDAAQDVFDRLIERVPGELRYRATAAEAMLGAKDKPRALRFVQEGLVQARKQQNRDSEQHFLELEAAARK